MTAPDAQERALLLRVLGALLREDVAGLRSRGTVRPPGGGDAGAQPDGGWLRLALPDGDALLLPVARDGFQADLAARLPLLRRESDGRDLTGCDAVLAALREAAEEPDRPGFDAYAAECRQTLATMRLHAAELPSVANRLAAEYGPDPADWLGHRGTLALDALAARLDHPVYPTARGRAGLGATELRAYAPEFHPRYRPRWIAVPRAAATSTGVERHPVWPAPSRLGLPAALDGSHLALPVHPLTSEAALGRALRATGLAADAHRAPVRWPPLAPTLSMRTGAWTGDPAVHLKLPLETATLGLLNRRTIKPGTLRDGAECARLLERVIAAEPRFAGQILHADESAYAHAGHELLAALLRVLPAGLDGAVVVPLAALLAEAPGGRLVVDHLADRFHGGDPLALLDAMLRPLFDWQTTLFGYGIALESHQQNVSLVLDRPGGGPTRVRLLFKDDDGPRIAPGRLRTALDGPLPEFDDPRVWADEGAVADLFTTVTVHLCAGAYAFGLARAGRAPLDRALAVVRGRLAEAVDRLPDGPRRVLRARVLDAARLPVKAMVSAGSLLSKARSGAADINKHYTDGPNYLHIEGSRAVT